MYQVQNISNSPKQKLNFFLPDGTQILISLYFIQMQYGWFIPTLTYNTFTLTGLRITNSPNMLYQFRNQIPFGLACATEGNREPTQQDDFASGAAKLYVLTPLEVQAYVEYLSGQI